MEHSVTLTRLPAGLRFPATLSERVRYDEPTRRLVFLGFMSKAEFDRLCVLSDDWSYRRSLEELFRLCSDEPGARTPARLARWLSPFRKPYV